MTESHAGKGGKYSMCHTPRNAFEREASPDFICDESDVLVLGAGGAGLPAAVAAAEAGAGKVTVLENRNSLGGTARMAGGLFAVESPVQKRLGIEFSADDFFKKHMDHCNWMCEARLVREWVKGSREVIEWLEQKGVVFNEVWAFSGRTRTYHSTPNSRTGHAIVKAMLKECQANGINILANTRAFRLCRDTAGRVTGVLAQRDGKTVEFPAKAVIVATGSISANKQLLSKYWPNLSFEGIRIMADTPSSTGDGLLMVQEVGAAEDALMSILWIGPHNYPNSVHVGLVARRPQVLQVNRYGMRYVDESLWVAHDYGWFAGAALERQPGRICYALLDENAMQTMFVRNRKNVSIMEDLAARVANGQSSDQMALFKGKIDNLPAMDYDPMAWMNTLDEDFRSEQEAGRAKIADSLEEIAEWMGADPVVLKASIEQYNAFCSNGYDADFLKPKEYLWPLTRPPYYAILAHEGIDTCIGGIRISHRMEVLDRELKAIDGLYAAGVATSGWLGPLYGLGGSELGFSVFSGRAAGRFAAAFAAAGGN